MTTLVDCPCCHGVTYLLVYDGERASNPPTPLACCHCSGTGTVMSEVSKFDDAEQVLRAFADWITAKRKATPP